MPNFFCKVNFVRNFIFISITNFMFRVTVKVERFDRLFESIFTMFAAEEWE